MTRFDTGEDSLFAAQGRVVHRGGWNLLSAQDPLPVGWCSEGDSLKAAVRYGTAYDGGSSLHLSGRAKDGSRRVYLYGAHARVSKHTRFLIRFDHGQGPRPHVVVSIAGIQGPVDLHAHRVTSDNGWVLSRANVPHRLAPAEITRVGVGFGHDGDRAAKVHSDVGELRIVNHGERPHEITPTRSGNDLSWKAAHGATLYYNVWASKGSCLAFIGRTQIARYDLTQPLFGPAPGGNPYEAQPVDASGRSGKLSGPRCKVGA